MGDTPKVEAFRSFPSYMMNMIATVRKKKRRRLNDK